MTPQQIWQAVLAELELSLSRANFITWFKNTFLESYENGVASVGVPSEFYKTWLEKKFHQNLIKLIEKITGESVRSLTYIIKKYSSIPSPSFSLSSQEENEIRQLSQTTTVETANVRGLNPRYTFVNFVVGKGNELAHAAAQAVAARPGQAYNPLFIYGGAGLGKTHLLQAVGNEILRQTKQKRVVYASCEKFTNDFIRSVHSGQIQSFYDNYRRADVLLIDDIQFISGKTETQETFFNTFNDLHQQDKQIFITSDRPPKAIARLENRLLSRFEMGMIADITPPELETRIAILMSKCEEKGFALPEESVSLIANSIQNNVRELEGALNKLHAYFQLKKTLPDADLIHSLIAPLENTASRRIITPKYLIQTVAEFFDLKIEDILGKNREKRFTYPRHIIMFLLRKELNASYPTIGAELGGRDHTTVMHACGKIERELQKNHKTREAIAQVRQRLFAA